jgi:hypothetical protein
VSIFIHSQVDLLGLLCKVYWVLTIEEYLEAFSWMATSTISLPLTTTFTPPSSCSSSWTYEAEYYNSVPGGLLLQNALATPLDTDCFPSGFSNNGRASSRQVYSPGFCPVGYTSPVVIQGGYVTTAVCCLKCVMKLEFTLQTFKTRLIHTRDFSYSTILTTVNFAADSRDTMIFAGCISTYPASSPPTIVAGRTGMADLLSSTVKGPITMWAQPINVEFDEGDLGIFMKSSTSSSTIATLPTSLGTTPAVSSLSSSTGAPQLSPSLGLSNGAKVGIGVGVAIGFLVLALAVFFIRRHRIKRRENHGRQEPIKRAGWKSTERDEPSQVIPEMYVPPNDSSSAAVAVYDPLRELEG